MKGFPKEDEGEIARPRTRWGTGRLVALYRNKVVIDIQCFKPDMAPSNETVGPYGGPLTYGSVHEFHMLGEKRAMRWLTFDVGEARRECGNDRGVFAVIRVVVPEVRH